MTRAKLEKHLGLKVKLDRIPRLQQENEQLRELLRLAVTDVKDKCQCCINRTLYSDNEKCKGCISNSYYKGLLLKWQWQHSDKLKGLIET